MEETKCTHIEINEVARKLGGEPELLRETLVGNEWMRLWDLPNGSQAIETNGEPLFEDADHRVFADAVEEYFPTVSGPQQKAGRESGGEMTERIYIRDTYDERVLVAKPEWFTTMPACGLYTKYGIAVDNEHERHGGECNCGTVRAYNFFNGSNWQSIVIDADYDCRYEEITDEEEIARYEEAIAKMDEPAIRTTGIDTYKVDGLEISKSIWQGGWELYTIQEDPSLH